MKRHIQFFVLLLLGASLISCGFNEDADSAESQREAKGGDHGESKSESGQTASHAEPDSDNHASESHEEPGEHGDEHAEGARVTLNAKQLAAAGIEIGVIGPARIRESIQLYGVISPNAERVRAVSARFPGVVLETPRKIGDAVREGDALALIESNESLRSYTLKAPISGVITERNTNPGEQADDQPLFTIADLNTVWVELSLFPRDVPRVKLGQEVIVKGPDNRQLTDGRVIYVAPFGRTANQTLSARVLLDNKDGTWAPGLNVTAEVTISESTVPLAVQSTAIQYLESQPVLFILHDGEFEARPVSPGRSDSETVEVTGGVDAGDEYAATNSFILKAELGKGSAEHDH